MLAFEGWNDAGESASWAARFLRDAGPAREVDTLDLEPLVDLTVTRPSLHRDERGARRIEWPTVRFHAGDLEPGLPLLVGVGPEPHLHWRSFCDDVVAIAVRHDVRRVALLGAFLADVLYSRPVRVTGFASDAATLERLGVESSGYEGPTGILGVLADALGGAGLEVVSLWAGLPHYIDASPNPRGTLALVEKATQWLGAAVDDRALCDAATGFEARISALVASDPTLSEYVRQLKRRDFAQ